MLTFVKLPGGRAGGEGKSHDDAVTSMAIADAVLKLRPKPVDWAEIAEYTAQDTPVRGKADSTTEAQRHRDQREECRRKGRGIPAKDAFLLCILFSVMPLCLCVSSVAGGGI
jgi:hypothetical protein